MTEEMFACSLSRQGRSKTPAPPAKIPDIPSAICFVPHAPCLRHPAQVAVTIASALEPPQISATSAVSFDVDVEESFQLESAVTYCRLVETASSTGLLVRWQSKGLDHRPAEELLSFSSSRLSATAEPYALTAGYTYTFTLTVAYSEDTRQRDSLEFTVRVRRETFYFNFDLQELTSVSPTGFTRTPVFF